MPSITFFDADIKSTFKNKRRLKKFIFFLLTEEKKVFQSLDFIFCSDEYLLSLNIQHLNHDYYTDILTFDLSTDKTIIAEIYISVDRVSENSKVHNVSFQQELTRIVFHGVLHLCGYNDKSKAQKKEMTKKENDYLEKYACFT